ncbi:MAG: flippase-like domain-containing protein, partial [Bacteroidia bacterium]|nr:flippase-like domain-containing protein [Bacteroidia bacterium]
MVIRDLGYIFRLRILSDKKMSWKQCFQVIMLWEFASAVSPGAIGGTAAAVVIMAQERLKTGLTTAIVLITSFLDELYYMLMIPIAFWAVNNTSLFPDLQDAAFQSIINTPNLRRLFWGGYIFLLIWTLFLAVALFIKPEICRGIIRSILSLPFLRRFKKRGEKLGNDLVAASHQFRQKPVGFWLKSMGATAVTWTARFLVINCLIMLLNHVDSHEHWVIFGKQLVMWILLMIAITPGGSGIAELIFPAFMGSYLPTKKVSRQLSILWRGLTYYPYIIAGILVLPFWMKRVGIQDKIRRINLLKKRR